MTSFRNPKRKYSGFPTIINAIPYANVGELHESAGGPNGGLRSGLKITVSIPPQLIAFRYPNLIDGNGSTPVIAARDRRVVNYRRKAYKKARRSIKGKDQAAKKRKYQEKFTTVFDISEFISNMSWSSASNNAFVQLNLTLDNIQGLFNYLPPGAKVTVWRRKQLGNINGTGRNWSTAGKWYPYIVSYIMDKSRTADGRAQKIDLVCQDRAGFLLANNIKKKTSYKKDKKHPNGWSPREITIDICKNNKIPYKSVDIPKRWRKGKLTAANTFPRLPKFETADKSVGAYISDSWKKSYKKIKRKDEFEYAIHMRTGTLVIETISPPGRNSTKNGLHRQDEIVMFNDTDNIESATLTEKLASSGEKKVFTQLYATGTYKTTKKEKNKKGKLVTITKKIKMKVFNPTNTLVQDAYGLRIRNKVYKKQVFANKKEFNQTNQRFIDDLARPQYTLEITAKGVLGLWPRRYVQITSKYLGIKGFFLLERVNYRLSEGQINVTLTLKVDRRHFAPGKDDKLNSYVKFPAGSPSDRWY